MTAAGQLLKFYEDLPLLLRSAISMASRKATKAEKDGK